MEWLSGPTLASVEQLHGHVSEVVPGLWVSGMPDPSWPLLEWGVGVLVCLSDHLPPQAARRFEWGTRGEAVGEGRIVFMHWPIADGPLPDLTTAHLITATAVAAIRGGATVLVHCQEGRNRSGLIAALAVRELRAVSGVQAIEIVRAVRPGMLSNRAFTQYLADLPAPRP